MHLLIRGNALAIPLADKSVHCVVTSPPYWGLRSYGIGVDKGELGLEATPDLYVVRMVAVFREVWRVLRDDGCIFVNIGDAYAHASSGGGGAVDVRTDGRKTTPGDQVRGRMGGANTMASGLKPKDLCGIPWRLAFALQADGWYLRSEIIWSKPNPMPESVSDRPTKSHEQVFLLAKREKYFFDADAVRQPMDGEARIRREAVNGMTSESQFKRDSSRNDCDGGMTHAQHGQRMKLVEAGGRNLRTVWSIPDPIMRLRSDLSSEKRAYVLGELSKRGIL